MDKPKSNTTERFLKSCLIFLLCAVLLNTLFYGMITFVLWQAKPSYWSWDARYLCVMLWFIGTCIAGGLAYFATEE
jgi:hypothetical protein